MLFALKKEEKMANVKSHTLPDFELAHGRDDHFPVWVSIQMSLAAARLFASAEAWARAPS